MDLSTALQPSHLLLLSPQDLHAHFKTLLGENPSDRVDAINALLVDGIASQALPATLYAIWLPLAQRHNTQLLRATLQNKTSACIREVAIKATTRLFHGPQWKTAGWDALGGVDGLATILEGASVSEIRGLAKAISRCRFAQDDGIRSTCVEELLQRLSQGSSRPLFVALSPLYALCSSAFVREVVCNLPDTPSTVLLLKPVAAMHADMLRQMAVGSVLAPFHVRVSILDACQSALVDSPILYTPVRDSVPDGLVPGMAFVLDLCHVLAEDASLRREFDKLDDYVRKAFRVAARRHLPFDRIVPLFTSIVKLPSRIFPKRALDSAVARELLRCWSLATCGKSSPDSRFIMKRITHQDHPSHPCPRHQSALETALTDFLRRHQDPRLSDKSRYVFFNAMQDVLLDVSRPARRRFLEHLVGLSDGPCYQPACEKSSFTFDITANPPQTRERELISVWYYDILRLLPAADAQVLFDRMLAIHRCKGFVPTDGQAANGLDHSQQCRLKAQWEAEGTGNMPLGRQLFLDLKQHAERQRNVTQRSRASRAAIQVAFDTYDIDLCREAVQWAQRFVRDSVVFPDIMSMTLLNNDQTYLGCVDMPSSRLPKDLAALRATVTSADQVLSVLLETIVLALSQPIDHSRSTYPVQSFLQGIVAARIRGIKRYRRARVGSEADIVDALLMPLIPVLLAWQRTGHDEGECWTDDDGFLHGLELPPRCPTAVLRFFDEYARLRNDLHREWRIALFPELADIDKGWPHGLQFQCLLPGRPWFGFALKHPDMAPYMAGRIQSVLDASPDIVFVRQPDHDEIVDDDHVDSMPVAVRALIDMHSTKLAKSDAMLALWATYQSRKEQYGKYFPILRDYLVHIAEEELLFHAANLIRRPRLAQATYLTSNNPTAFQAWDPTSSVPEEAQPAADERHNLKAKCLATNLLFYRLCGELDDKATISIYEEPFMHLQNRHWAWPKLRFERALVGAHIVHKMSPSAREATIISALMFLELVMLDLEADWVPPTDAKSRKSSPLAVPFPDAATVRYPAMYLSTEFVKVTWDDVGKAVVRCIDVLRACMYTVPVKLVSGLMDKVLDALETLERPHGVFKFALKTTFSLIQALVLSDCPEVAVAPVVRVIESFPSESAYHRQMKLLSLCRRLRPESVAAFLERLAAFVCEKLVEQQRRDPRKLGPPRLTSKTNSPGYVKTTTVKMLAQLLAQADFLPLDTTLRILGDVFHSTHHVDIRTEIVKAALGLFDSVVASPAGLDRLFAFIKDIAYEAAGGPSEMDPAGDESTWATALPSVSSVMERPALELLVDAAHSKLPPSLRASYVQQVLFPLVTDSQNSHDTWMDALLAPLHLSRTELGIPTFGPFDPQLIDNIVYRWSIYLPARFLLTEHTAWALTPVLHWKAYAIIGNTLATLDPEYRQTNAGQHWEELVSRLHTTNPLATLSELLRDGAKLTPLVADGITREAAVKEFAHRTRQLARHPVQYCPKARETLVSLDRVVSALRLLRAFRVGDEDVGAETRKARYTVTDEALRSVVRDVESLRGTTDGRPPVVPAELELCALLLPSPVYSPDAGRKDRLEGFVNAVVGVISRWRASLVLVMDFAALECVVDEVVTRDIVAVVELFDSSKGQRGLGALERGLIIKLMQRLLRRLSLDEVRLSEKLRALVGGWRENEDEFVSRVGWGVPVPVD